MRKLVILAAVVTTVGAASAIPAVAGAAAADLPAPTQVLAITGAATAAPSGTHPPTLVGVRVGRHDRYDRVVFDFTGGTPAYAVRYAPLVDEGRGQRVPLAGAASLLVRFSGAFPYDLQTGQPTINLGRVLNPGFPTLRQVRFGGAFEGYLSAGLGLRDRVGFRVLRLTNPPRIAVDVAHQPTQPFIMGRYVGGDATAPIVDIARVRSGRHPGYDRAVFDLRTSGTPIIMAGYVTGLRSTLNVGLTGLQVKPAVISAPSTVQIGLPQLRTVSFRAYENGTVSIRIETRTKHGYRIMVLYHPTRIVVDVAY